ncbi:NAD-dependent epimerase/dehydratase family protein [uncultured Ilyobacter sp.]|uniref:NAD-dependent epimerase/dehydratase family protein n=1 Tax=uncultured Ilyobacter sp. TaxID=544433 RepID=UPI002AA6964A|nr:NAD-dependent epimerase/dehydratase family protein [uncultured Ilyobacter sp.]
MKNVLIVGGNGFIGRNLVKYLTQDKELKVKVFDLNSSNLQEYIIDERIEFIEGNLEDRESIKKSLDNTEDVIYLSSVTDVIKSVENPFLEIKNLEFMLNFLEEAKFSSVKRIFYASSGGTVYGESKQLPLVENLEKNPISPYGIMKLSIEHFLEYYSKKFDLEYVILRYSNLYGNNLKDNLTIGAVDIFLKKILSGDEIEIYGNPSKIVRDYIYIEDLTKVHHMLIKKERLNHHIFNVGSGIETSLQDIIECIENFTYKKAKVKIKESKVENVSRVVLDISKLKEEIKWKPINLPQAMENILRRSI